MGGVAAAVPLKLREGAHSLSSTGSSRQRLTSVSSPGASELRTGPGAPVDRLWMWGDEEQGIACQLTVVDQRLRSVVLHYHPKTEAWEACC